MASSSAVARSGGPVLSAALLSRSPLALGRSSTYQGGSRSGSGSGSWSLLRAQSSSVGADSREETARALASIQAKRIEEAQERARAFAEAKAQQFAAMETSLAEEDIASYTKARDELQHIRRTQAKTQQFEAAGTAKANDDVPAYLKAREEIQDIRRKEAEARAAAYAQAKAQTLDAMPPPPGMHNPEANAKAVYDAKAYDELHTVRQNEEMARANAFADAKSGQHEHAVARTSAAPGGVQANVHFELHYKSIPGECIVVAGNHNLLGAWDAYAGVPLEWTGGDIWKGAVNLPVGDVYDYKYALINDLGSTFEKGANRIMVVDSETSVSDTWEESSGSSVHVARGSMSTSAKLRATLQVARKEVAEAMAANRALKTELQAKNAALREELESLAEYRRELERQLER